MDFKSFIHNFVTGGMIGLAGATWWTFLDWEWWVFLVGWAIFLSVTSDY